MVDGPLALRQLLAGHRITAQICSGVYVAGAPDRGASASRSGTDCPSAARRHRLHLPHVFRQTPSSRALARTRAIGCAHTLKSGTKGNAHANGPQQPFDYRCQVKSRQALSFRPWHPSARLIVKHDADDLAVDHACTTVEDRVSDGCVVDARGPIESRAHDCRARRAHAAV
jgi:hypothetical protein